ncbi:MAG TPA: tetratricopeptide repeat protein [Polyangiaceae bacterium]|jgi:Flp pilus assembly protein TadD
MKSSQTGLGRRVGTVRIVRGLGFGVVAACIACGGSSPPAQTGGSDPGTSSLSDPTPAPAAEPPPSAELAAGIKAFDAGNYPDARKSFDAAAKKNPRDYQALLNLGLACEKLSDPSSAESAYKAALAVKPDLEAASEELSALELDAGRSDDAAAVARAGLAKNPSSGPLHENLGLALAAKGDQDNATKELSQAAQITPTDPMLQLTLAHWLNVWHVRGAAPHLDQARDLAKDDLAMLASIGLEYRLAGEFDSCVKTFDHAVAIKDGGEVRTERALCRLGLKDEKGTLADLQAAVQKEPTYAPAHYYLGGRLAMTKHFKEAAAEYSKYLELAPSGSLAARASERLKDSQDAMGKKK